MEKGSSGIRIITAITISGCSLLFLALLRNIRADSTQSAPDGQTADDPRPKPSTPSGKKKVRFSEEVEEPSGNNVEYRRRRRSGVGQRTTVRKRGGSEKKVVELPSNRSALYSGIHQYRSQMSMLMIYG